MSQKELTSYFNSRKRVASDDIVSSKNKIRVVDGILNGSRSKTEVKLIKTDNIRDKQLSSNDFKLLNVQPERVVIQQNSSVFTKKANITNIGKSSKSSKSELIKVERQELSLGDIRKKLANSPRLAALKSTADRISKGIQQLQESSEKRKLKEFESVQLEVPPSTSPDKASVLHEVANLQKTESPRKVCLSPIKSPLKVPANTRQNITTASDNLPLPHHYRLLSEVFRSMEFVISVLYNRNEKITFTKLKHSIQEMQKRNFTEKHLAQIKTVVPDFYHYEVQKVKNFCSSVHKNSYELVISPNFPKDNKCMNPSVILERNRYFYDCLLNLVRKHHTAYLISLDPPIHVPEDKINRWHSEFEVEKVPEIRCAKLPEINKNEKVSTASDVLSKAHEMLKCNTKMGRALERLAQRDSTTDLNNKQDSKTTQTAPSTSTVTLINPALRNLPASLLEKVKAKQAAKALEAITRPSEYDQKYIMYSKLPELARCLRNIFVTERKNVLALNVILSKLGNNFMSNVSSVNLRRDIKLLAEEMPQWVNLTEIRKETYLKLDKNADLTAIITKLDSLTEKYKY